MLHRLAGMHGPLQPVRQSPAPVPDVALSVPEAHRPGRFGDRAGGETTCILQVDNMEAKLCHLGLDPEDRLGAIPQ